MTHGNGPKKGHMHVNFWLVALGALYQLGHHPTTGGGHGPSGPPGRSAIAIVRTPPSMSVMEELRM